jgi:hypothetical protein
MPHDAVDGFMRRATKRGPALPSVDRWFRTPRGEFISVVHSDDPPPDLVAPPVDVLESGPEMVLAYRTGNTSTVTAGALNPMRTLDYSHCAQRRYGRVAGR